VSSLPKANTGTVVCPPPSVPPWLTVRRRQPPVQARFVAGRYTSRMDTRTLFIVGILGFAFAGVVNSLWFGLELRRFVDRTPVLASRLDMMRFKKVVSHQMYAALVQLVVLSAPIVIFAAGIMFKVLGGTDFLFIIIPSVVILVLAGITRRWETRAKTIPVADPEIEAERNTIVHTWLRKPWPDW